MVVIGAGIVGCAVARSLLALEPGLRVILLDAEHVGAGSTSRSTAAFRHQWSVPAHVAFSRYSAREYDELAARGHPIGFRRAGYLFLHTELGRLERAAARARAQQALGVERVEVLSPAELPDRVPCAGALRLDSLAGAVWGPDDGFLDPLAAAQALLAEARRAGAVYRPDCRVRQLLRAGGAARGVRLQDGEQVTARRVVCAAGVWSAALLREQDLPLPFRPAKRYLYHSRPIRGLDVGGWPMIIGDRGAHTRPTGGNTLLLSWEHRPAPLDAPAERELWERQDTVEPGYGTGIDDYGVEVLAELARLIPPLAERVGLAHVTSGWYALSPDRKAILGEDPRLPGLFHACGFSGHGVMHAPATGRTVAELVLDRPTSVVPREQVERGFALAPLLQGLAREPVEEMGL